MEDGRRSSDEGKSEEQEKEGAKGGEVEGDPKRQTKRRTSSAFRRPRGTLLHSDNRFGSCWWPLLLSRRGCLVCFLQDYVSVFEKN